MAGEGIIEFNQKCFLKGTQFKLEASRIMGNDTNMVIPKINVNKLNMHDWNDGFKNMSTTVEEREFVQSNFTEIYKLLNETKRSNELKLVDHHTHHYIMIYVCLLLIIVLFSFKKWCGPFRNLALHLPGPQNVDD